MSVVHLGTSRSIQRAPPHFIDVLFISNMKSKMDQKQKTHASSKKDGKTPESSMVSKLQSQITDSVTSNSFSSVKPTLSSGILAALAAYKFTTMTPVQAAVIPLFLKNKDVCVQAVTGSGKTLSFMIPMVEMILRRPSLLKKNQIGGLIIAPTRELARQTHDVARHVCKYSSLTDPLLLVGGRPVSEDLESFASLGSDIVIGTPGRIEDILSRYNDIQVNDLECLVLDEADVLLDMGFEVTLTNILSHLPKMRRTGLFSATKANHTLSGDSSNNNSINRLISRAGLRNPVMIDVTIASPVGTENKQTDSVKRGKRKLSDDVDNLAPQELATPTSLTNFYIISSIDEKLSRLVAFLRQHQDQKIIIFFLTCASVEFFGLALQQLLPPNQHYIELLHGKLNPKRREKAMERFRNSGRGSIDQDDYKLQTPSGAILCVTDVAARGLDVPDIEWTIQFDAPVDPVQYIHRVGRSARAGRRGSSLIFLTSREEAYVDFLKMRKVPINVLPSSESCAPSLAPEENIAKDIKEIRFIRNANGDTLPDILPCIRNMVLQDRDFLEKGTKAFTAHVRAYKEHQCSFIFRFAVLDLGLLAQSFCLLRLPKMPELKEKLGKLNFQPAGPEIDIHAIKFKDKIREKARQKRLAAELAAGGKNAKLIKAEQRAAAKLQHQKERRAAEILKGRNPDKKRGKQAQIFDEWEELGREERLFKKFKKGKLSKAQYEALLHSVDGKLDDDSETSYK